VEQWFRALPPVTRWHFASVVIVTLAGNFGLVNPLSIALLQEQIFKKFEATIAPLTSLTVFRCVRRPLILRPCQIWRLATNMMFMGKLGFGFLIHLMFLYQHRQRNTFLPEPSSLCSAVGSSSLGPRLHRNDSDSEEK